MMKSALSLLAAKRIRAMRKAKGLSQEDFADLCSLHRTYIGAIERSVTP
ncbi:MAG: helix-turn-helix transcriptional regulator [Alphaproteobacteria bacterium]